MMSWVFCFIVLSRLMFVCKCVLYYRHLVTTQLQLTIYNICLYFLFPNTRMESDFTLLPLSVKSRIERQFVVKTS